MIYFTETIKIFQNLKFEMIHKADTLKVDFLENSFFKSQGYETATN